MIHLSLSENLSPSPPSPSAYLSSSSSLPSLPPSPVPGILTPPLVKMFLQLPATKYQIPINMLKLWLLYNLLLTGAIFGTSLTSAHSLTNYLLPLLLLPLLYYLGKELLKKPRRRKLSESFASTLPTSLADLSTETLVKAEEGTPMPGISDDNRRLFLKLVGSTSLSIFFMAVLGKKSASAAFFGSVPGPGTISVKNSEGVTIDPSEKQPTDGYTITEVDDTGNTSYYGFVHKTGAWYITQETNTGAYRYAKGTSLFSTSWTGRTLLTYDYFDNVF